MEDRSKAMKLTYVELLKHIRFAHNDSYKAAFMSEAQHPGEHSYALEFVAPFVSIRQLPSGVERLVPLSNVVTMSREEPTKKA